MVVLLSTDLVVKTLTLMDIRTLAINSHLKLASILILIQTVLEITRAGIEGTIVHNNLENPTVIYLDALIVMVMVTAIMLIIFH